jgi:hypothetical protein
MDFQFKKRNKIIDKVPAKKVYDYELIACSYIHVFFDNPLIRDNKKAGDIIIDQVDRTGKVSGRPDIKSTAFSGKKLAKSHTISVSQKTDG